MYVMGHVHAVIMKGLCATQNLCTSVPYHASKLFAQHSQHQINA